MEDSKADGTMIILPDNIANTMYIAYRSMNGNINLIVNHYVKSGAKVPEFDKQIGATSELVCSVRSKYTEVTPVICCDFNVQAKGTHYCRLL